MTRLAVRTGLVGAVLTAALITTVATAGTASATRTSGGWYSTSGGCSRAGGNAVNQGGFDSFECNYFADHNPAPWHLVLIS